MRYKIKLTSTRLLPNFPKESSTKKYFPLCHITFSDAVEWKDFCCTLSNKNKNNDQHFQHFL